MRDTNLALLVVLSTLGCGGDGAECGPGTVLEDGVCVVSRGGGDDGASDDDVTGDRQNDSDDPGDDVQPDGMDMDGDGDIDHEGTDMDGDDVGDPAGDPPADDVPEDPGNGDPPPMGEAQPCDSPESCAGLGQQIFDAVNAARAAAGACGGAALAWCDGCAASAAGHSAAMSAVNGMTSDDGSLGTRLDAQGVSWSAVGEVYGRARGTPAELVDLWMGAAAGEYLRSCDYTMAGVGLAPASPANAAAWVTVTLISP